MERFFSLVSSGFDSIVTGNALDLNPLWDSLTAEHRESELYGLFFKFEEAGTRIGLNVHLPLSLVRLSKRSRQVYLREFDATNAPSKPPPPADPEAWLLSAHTPLPSLSDQATIEAAKQNYADSSRHLPPSTKDAIAQALVWALKSSPAGDKLNSGQLNHMFRSNFDAMCDGRKCDLGQFTDLLLATPEVTGAALFPAVIRFQTYLARIGIEMREPKLGLNSAERASLLKELGDTDDLYEASAPPAADEKPRSRSAADAFVAAIPGLEPGTPSGSHDIHPHGTRPGRGGAPIVGAALATVALLGVGWVLRPVKPLGSAEYAAVFPVEEVKVVDGVWVGVLDVKRWSAMDDADRRLAVDKLQGILAAQGRLEPDRVAIIAEDGKAIMFASKEKKLVPTESLMAIGRQ